MQVWWVLQNALKRAAIALIVWAILMAGFNTFNGWPLGEAVRKVEYDAKIVTLCYMHPGTILQFWTISYAQAFNLALAIQPVDFIEDWPWFAAPGDQQGCGRLETLLKFGQ